MLANKQSNKLALYRNKFFAYGLFGFLDEWIERDFAESPEEIIRIFQEQIVDHT